MSVHNETQFELEECGTCDSRSFRVFPRESAADEDEESGPGQTVLLISILPCVF